MKKYFFFILLTVGIKNTYGQNVGIGTTTPNVNAALDISSSTKGLLTPRTSTASRTAILNPPKGLMVYDTTHAAFFYYDGGTWRPFYEKNYDTATIDYYNVNGLAQNLPTSTSGFTTGASTSNSGFLYDNGGPLGNYSANNFSSRIIYFDDSTLQIKITIEEMNAEVFYDSLFILQFNGIDYNDTIATFTGTQTGTVIAHNSVKICFKANAINQFAGFKIRWGRLRSDGALQILPPLYGWYFNNAKLAAMGGIQKMNNWHKDSVGFGSISYGIGNKAKGYASVAMGQRSYSLGPYSIAMGAGAIANGDRAIAIGDGSALKDFATVVGYSNAYGYASTALGFASTASGSYSVAIGQGSTANGSQSFALGGNNLSQGEYSVAIGVGAQSMGYASTAIGGNTTLGEFSSAMGISNYANGYASTVVGINADSIVTRQTAIAAATPLFIVGNGNASNDRSNALVVLKNGNVAIGNNGTPVNKLQITGTISNTSLADNSGMMTLGFTSSTNMVMDPNDVQVRLAGATSDLYLQRLGGSIGIGNTGVPAYQLELSTNSAGKPGTNTWSIASDSRLKQNVHPYNQGLQQLLQIKPVTYNYNEKSGFDTKPEYVGIIAQDLQKIAPYMVSTVKRKDAEYLSVDNGAMTYMLINAVKEQQQQIEQLKKEIELLKQIKSKK